MSDICNIGTEGLITISFYTYKVDKRDQLNCDGIVVLPFARPSYLFEPKVGLGTSLLSPDKIFVFYASLFITLICYLVQFFNFHSFTSCEIFIALCRSFMTRSSCVVYQRKLLLMVGTCHSFPNTLMDCFERY